MIFRFKKVIYYWLPAVLWMGFIFLFSSFHKLQASEIAWKDFIIRKTAHFLEYAILCFLFFRAFRKTTSFSQVKILFFSFILTFFYAITDEYHQTWVAGRSGRVIDVGIDSLGAVFGLLFSGKIISLLPEKIKKVIL